MTTPTVEQVQAAERGEQEGAEGIMCPLCPTHDPFADAKSLQMHTIRMHANVPDVTDDPDEGVTPAQPAPAPHFGGLDPAKLAQIDQIGTAGSPIDQTPEAILARQVANGGLFDPITLKRIVVLGGIVRVRQTVGYDADRGRAERIDYWQPDFGWMRDGFIIERGRIHMDEAGKPLAL